MEQVISMITAILAGMGVGGGGLLVIYLTSFTTTPIYEARVINLVFFLSSCVSAIPFHFFKRKINIKCALVLIIFGTIGAISGSIAGNIVQSQLIKKVFGGVMIISGIIALWKNKKIFFKKTIDKNENR